MSTNDMSVRTDPTIVAISTPPGISGLAVLRLSGSKAAAFCDQLFAPAKTFPKPSAMQPYTVAVGNWYGEPARDTWIDQVVLTCFRAPRSYTGEDVFEISCHGSRYAKAAILQSLLDVGAEPAGPGEFTKRAFINGKLDLAQAEAVRDLIEAEASRQTGILGKQLRGDLSRRFASFRDRLYDVMAQVEMILEFPEHEDTPEARDAIYNDLTVIRKDVSAIRQTYEQGRIIRQGMRVVLAGRPNAGKSSLLNDLVREDRAIVTDIAGTTRDTLDIPIQIDGLPVILTDTAGMRVTDDPVEREGVRRAESEVQRADLVLWLIASDQQEEAEEDIVRIREVHARGMPVIPVVAKDDLASADTLAAYLADELPDFKRIRYSAMTEGSADQVRQAIFENFTERGNAEGDQLLISELRHAEILDHVAEYIEQAEELMEQAMPLDIMSTLLRAAAEQLAELSGESVTEGLVETIFQAFCVGK